MNGLKEFSGSVEIRKEDILDPEMPKTQVFR